MRSLAADPNSRENFMLAYRLIAALVRRHHKSDRLHVLGYINKTKGYYTIYLTQDPSSPLSSAYGYFNVSLGNFRSTTDSEVYYYFNEFKDGQSDEDIVNKIESMIGLPNQIATDSEEHMYCICISVLSEIIQTMAARENGFAVENEMCPFLGPYSKVPDNQLWHDLIKAVSRHGHDLKERCTYDYFAIGTGVPGGPVYRSWGFIANDGYVYYSSKSPFNLVQAFKAGKSYREIAKVVIDELDSHK